jgi:hypothetical protein
VSRLSVDVYANRGHYFEANVKERATLLVGAGVDHEIDVKITVVHVTRVVDRGCVSRLVLYLRFFD